MNEYLDDTSTQLNPYAVNISDVPMYYDKRVTKNSVEQKREDNQFVFVFVLNQ